ncbi:MAG: pentapeptide repeat-containing protein [Methanothrix sp.]
MALILLMAEITTVDCSDYTKTVPASEILAKIEKGEPVEYDHVIIKGDLDLSQLNLPNGHINRSLYDTSILGLTENAKIVTSEIKIINATIEGNVNFGETVFYSPIDFSGSNFTCFAIFHGAQFSTYTNVFSDVAVFSGIANFNNARFYNGIDFIGASGPTYFMDTEFDKIAHFWGAKLYNAWFSRAKFNSTYIDFRKAQFIGQASFSEAQFDVNDGPLFKEAQFNGDVYFRGTKFNGTSNFIGSQFSRNVDFTYAEFGGDAVFNGAKFSGYIVGWRNLDNVFKCDDEVTYLGLIQDLKDHGQFTDADNCYYDYMNWRRDQDSGFSKVSDWLFCAICGYGVKPQRPIIFGGIIIIIFGIIYYLGSRHYPFVTSNNWQKMIESIFFSAVALLSLPKELYPYGPATYDHLLKQNIFNIRILGFRFLVSIERLLGWSILILFINTLSRVMIRY